jgi:hypothetical protein
MTTYQPATMPKGEFLETVREQAWDSEAAGLAYAFRVCRAQSSEPGDSAARAAAVIFDRWSLLRGDDGSNPLTALD